MTIKRPILLLLTLVVAGCGTASTGASGDEVIEPRANALVIAHRGASGYLPEHTLAAKAMAYAQGADYIEQDLVMTKDGRLVVLHDKFLDTVSNVAEIFPGRQRDDGRFYVIDFNLDEIRQLSVSERFYSKDGAVVPVFTDRFPLGKSSFRINTLEEEIELVQGLNKSTGRTVGIYPEIKSPAFHRREGQDISAATLAILKRYGYTQDSDAIYLQCFDADELVRIHDELMPDLGVTLPLVQLIDTTEAHRWMLSKEGIERVAAYADGIGPPMRLLINPDSVPPNIEPSSLLADAHAAGLQVHPYTFRREQDQLPPFSRDYDDLLRLFIDEFGVDGVFTDFPDLTVKFIESDR